MNASKTSDMHVLLVEDEESVLRLTGHLLEMQGFHVIACPHSEAALRKAAHFPGRINLLVTDVRMDPHMSGCKMAQQLRNARPDLAVVYMSAYPSSEIVRKEVEQGAAELLKKPFTPTVLLETVNRALEHSRTGSALRSAGSGSQPDAGTA